MRFFYQSFFLSGLLFLQSASLFCNDVDRRIPDEFETVGGHGLGLANGGVAAQSGLAAIRVNPALLSLEPTYTIGAGYNWPTQGREFYQAGVIDSQSSSVAAGFLYTGYYEDYKTTTPGFEKDSPVTRRAHLSLAQSLGLVSAGIGVQYLEALSYADPYVDVKTRGTSLSAGIAGLLTPTLRFGFSAENIANKRINEFAPRTFRGGLALLFGEGDATIHLDLRQRDRIVQQEQSSGFSDLFNDIDSEKRQAIFEEDHQYEVAERMMFLSGSARVFDMLRLLGAYGRTIMGPVRSYASAGIALVSGNFVLSYSAARPYVEYESSQQAVSFSFNISF